MNEQPKFNEWFHKFLINFGLWAAPLLGIISAVRSIIFSTENRAPMLPLMIILSVLLILVCLFCVKVRFDLATFRRIAVKELLWVCLAAAALIFLIHFLLYENGAKDDMNQCWEALIVALWGIALFRYYKNRPFLFKD